MDILMTSMNYAERRKMKLRNKETGEIVELKLIQVDDKHLADHEVSMLNGEELTLELLVNSFGDIKDPLIKDEKMRKAVGAWAEANDIDAGEQFYVTSPTFDNKFLTIENGGLILSSYYDDESIKDGSYTIDELCGEEE